MIATFTPSLFEQDAIDDLDLLECFALAHNGRHILVYEKTLDTKTEHWISNQSSNLQEKLRQILSHSKIRASRMPDEAPKITIIAGGTSEWPNARLCLHDATRLLREPLHILLENAINDLAFLRRLAPTAHRNDLDRAISRGWAIVDNAGGIDGIKQIIEGLRQLEDSSQGRFQRLRYWIMFDRDSDEADRSKPANKTKVLADKLAEQKPDDPWTVSFYRLERRAIENYLPTQALQRATSGYERTACDALERLRLRKHNAACQYNMKSGLLGDNNPLKKRLESQRSKLRANLTDLAQQFVDNDCDKLFRGCGDQDRAALAYGFTKDIADCYVNDQAPAFERDLQAEYERGNHDLTREQILESLLQQL
jgi:hypothetical protein